MPNAISNFFMKTIVNSPLHPLLGNRFAVITFEGRKSGKRYSTPINVAQDGETFTAVSLRSRNWWRNLRGGRQAKLRVSGRQYTVRGEVLERAGELAGQFDLRFLGRRSVAGAGLHRDLLEIELVEHRQFERRRFGDRCCDRRFRCNATLIGCSQHRLRRAFPAST